MESLCDEDMQFLHDHGFNLVRLGVQFDGTYPTCGEPDTDYLDTMRDIVDDLASYGIYTIIDLHQDLLSKWFCGEGFPPCLFPSNYQDALKMFPEPWGEDIERDEDGFPLHDACLEQPFPMYYLTVEDGKAWECLYNNCNPYQEEDFGGSPDSTEGMPLQELFLKHWSSVAETMKSSEFVLGYELLNEPWVGDTYEHLDWMVIGKESDLEHLTPLYESAINEIVKQDDAHLILYEPMLTNFEEAGFPEGGIGTDVLPQGSQQNVLSVHDYCGLVNSKMDPISQTFCDAWDELVIVDVRERDVERLGLGALLLTEFGAIVDEDDSAIEDLEHILSDYERHLLSFCYWQFKTYHDVTTAAGSGSEGLWSEDGTLFENKLKALSRPFPMKISGELKSFSFDVDTSVLEVYMDPDLSVQLPSVIFTSEDLYYPTGYKVSFDPSGSGTWRTSTETNRIEIYAQTNQAFFVRIEPDA
ncbi:cellulase (glycosyl hydrolase family 5) subfamily protein [Aduncisulcus paluster]|uniref:Cellulase (Glycosyl hydrolase family 5) subfamily protein n=1 Tax=Aduncisulcus paluster TaxID=2918883 RepID=A0ABQ5KVV2_9EUKA|nr:cellulase (glycosyl hydrolase family 5) subfamily protein [Aduncisulcus paluster]